MEGRPLLILGACALLVSALPVTRAAAAEKQNVLVLASRDSQQPAYEQFMSGFRTGVNARAGVQLELFTEFLDSSRFPQTEQRMRMRQLLQDKYAATRIDLVVSTSPYALDFVLEYRVSLFPRVPVVYALVSNLELPPRPLPTDVIGIVDRFDLTKTLDMARRLQPNVHRVVIVTGAEPFDRMWEDIARRDLQTAYSGLEFAISGLPPSRPRRRGCPGTQLSSFFQCCGTARGRLSGRPTSPDRWPPRPARRCTRYSRATSDSDWSAGT